MSGPAELPSPFESRQLEFQTRMLELLESIDSRLSSIAVATNYLQSFVEGIERTQAFERNMRESRY